MPLKVIIWDKDGTITGSRSGQGLLPNVEKVMNSPGVLNIICSGCATPESEQQNFDPARVSEKIITLMNDLPIQAATFSPAIGGTQCYVVTNQGLHKAHEEPRYQHMIGEFKKPGVGMLLVIRDLLVEKLDCTIETAQDMLMVGDTWHDEEAARCVGIPFLKAQQIHDMPAEKDFLSFYRSHVKKAG